MTKITSRCPHCHSMNRLPVERIESTPTCGRCKKELLQGAPIEGTNANLSALINGDKPVVIDFWAPWCGPCINFAPTFTEVATQNTTARFVKIDTEDQPLLGAQYNIRSIPTLMVFKQGKVVDTLNGALPAGQFKAWLAQALLK
ncbi:thioredoxin TrxC [Psychromonas sp. 14N.309.X.WAT.B.A12]|uniref:thioredoxin TrxC n=1 Tax=Psychromonas sp. 14N.309.X.WAT.B.A12 TaxID=2998322 RepID=UPI0025B2588D|nr:thioredoxin TrxC [Psychromonas sp. 14N.309.X.WAT.B.A12]MDN2663765.1 thioredoxin TrxC [Psychromonas sp. 14N.309.X.WAT.B.A12]